MNDSNLKALKYYSVAVWCLTLFHSFMLSISMHDTKHHNVDNARARTRTAKIIISTKNNNLFKRNNNDIRMVCYVDLISTLSSPSPSPSPSSSLSNRINQQSNKFKNNNNVDDNERYGSVAVCFYSMLHQTLLL